MKLRKFTWKSVFKYLVLLGILFGFSGCIEEGEDPGPLDTTRDRWNAWRDRTNEVDVVALTQSRHMFIAGEGTALRHYLPSGRRAWTADTDLPTYITNLKAYEEQELVWVTGSQVAATETAIVASFDYEGNTGLVLNLDSGDGADIARDVHQTEAGVLIVAGETSGSWDGNSSLGEDDIFIQGINVSDESAAFTSVQTGSAGYDGLNGLHCDDEQQVCYGFGLTTGDVSRTNAGVADGLVFKFDYDGNILWQAQAGGPAFDTVTSLAIDVQNGQVIAGGFSEGQWATASSGKADVVLWALNPDDGSTLWQSQEGSVGNDYIYDLVIQGSRLYAAGTTDDQWGSDFWGNRDLIMLKLTTNGELLVNKQMGTILDDRYSGGFGFISGRWMMPRMTFGVLNGIRDIDQYLQIHQRDERWADVGI